METLEREEYKYVGTVSTDCEHDEITPDGFGKIEYAEDDLFGRERYR